MKPNQLSQQIGPKRTETRVKGWKVEKRHSSGNHLGKIMKVAEVSGCLVFGFFSVFGLFQKKPPAGIGLKPCFSRAKSLS